MKSSLNSAKKNMARTSKKITIFLLVFVMFFSFLITPLHPAQAVIPVTDSLSAALKVKGDIWVKMQAVAKYLWQKSGSVAFQSVLRSALNKIAYDTANYIGSGGKGQKPLFITQDWGSYLSQVGDEAAGQFIEEFAGNLSQNEKMVTACQNTYQTCNKPCQNMLLGAPCTDGSVCTVVLAGGVCADGTSCSLPSSGDTSAATDCTSKCKDAYTKCANANATSTNPTGTNFVNTPSFNICQPSSLEAKVKIGLGLVEQQRPGAPNCTASKMVNNWGDSAQSMYDDVVNNPNFLQTTAKGIFDPTSNDLGLFVTAHNDMLGTLSNAKDTSKTKLAANKGWLDKTNIAGTLLGTPNLAAEQASRVADGQQYNLGRITGDVVVDAANVFLNQLAISKFNDLMSNLGKKVTGGSTTNVTNKDSETQFGESNLQGVTSTLIKPDFGVRADYDILSSLVVCPDKTNPSPTNCVIDDKFMQGITENKTVAEAIQDGYIHGDWQLTQDTRENSYSLRNIQILIKYRILPIGWQEAVNQAFADPNNPKKVTVMDLVSCFDPYDSYNQFSSDFDTRNQTWCRGLIDPNWVLKAPLNRCLKLGDGAQIVSRMVTPSIAGTNGDPNTPSSLGVTRAEDYCADEQTCIKEKSDGSCDVYGYCNEEKRTWNFSSDSCDPINNTCQSFTNPITGNSVSYLENTLNYSGCNADSAGCRQYSLGGSYSSLTSAVSWDAAKSVYFNKNVQACNSGDEACTELLRIKPTWGANLVMDSDYNNENIGDSASASNLFKDWNYWSSTNTDGSSRTVSIVDPSLEPGGANGKAMKLAVSRTSGNTDKVTVGVYSNSDHSLLPNNFQIISGQAYTVSADVYLAAGDNVHIYMGDVADGYVSSTNVTGSWQHISITRMASDSYSEPDFGINADSSNNTVNAYIRNLKFEVSDFDNSYSVYGAKKTYEKLIPPYLESSCYNNASSATKDYTLKDDAPSVCSNYARKCNRDEVGCEAFTNVKNGLAVSAQVTSQDYCPSQCLGYDVYVTKQDQFNSPQSENLIPATAQTCGAESAGCSEFTNLDAISQGGEKKEYYTAIKQCIKPNQNTCGSFYSWEGTDSGYQLRSTSLKKDINNNPVVTSDDSALCNAAIYNKTVDDPLYNADCREFYNSTGQVSYHLVSKTITCSDDCHAYRMSEKNVDRTLSQADCNANPSTSHWDTTNNVCNVCLNGGNWDSKLSACVYQAIPGEGQTCTAAENGCREYNGNDGNNVRMLASYNFENGAQGWTSNCSAGLKLSTIANNKDGHSLQYKNSANNCLPLGSDQTGSVAQAPIIQQVFASDNVAAQLKVGSQVTQGKSYSIRFLAKADSDTNLKVYFYNNDQTNPQFAEFATSTLVVKGGGEWNIYQTNLENLDHAVTNNEVMIISADNDFYFDDVVLTEITDRYYLIKNSSVIPDICYYDMADKYQGADYNLGCSQYTDANSLKHNLHKFSKLCSDSAVGCEQMIATQNYTPYGTGIWNDTNKNGVCDSDEPDCIKVDADKAVYAVYDANKQCNSADLGCSRVGQGAANSTLWNDQYVNNNPNLYDTILCSHGEVGCEEWKANDSTLNYFRDPGNETCEYRDSHSLAGSGKAWYKIAVNRCDLNGNNKIDGSEMTGNICSTKANCATGNCISDTNDYPCSTSYFKTFGIGGAGNQVSVPDKQAGLCEPNASGCTEYIDPVSQISPNLIYNPSFEATGANNTIEGWDGTNQTVTIEPNKLYIFSTKDNNGSKDTSLNFPNVVKQLGSDNNLSDSIKTITISAKANQNIIFASLSNTSVVVSGGEANKLIELRGAIINYQLQENVDKTSCNGLTNFDNGCVLFNERAMNGGVGYANLNNKYDAAGSTDKQAPSACNASIAGSCTSNQLIKVTPNRSCAKWLDCMTYVQDPTTNERTCYAVGECTRLSDKNECANFEDAATSTMTFSKTGVNKNSTGYYLLNKYHLSNMQEVGYDTDAHFDFEDSVPALSCQRADSSGAECAFNKNIVSDLLVREPENSPTDYPAHGASYLKAPASFLISPQTVNSWVNVQTNTDYYINFLVNTKNTGLAARIVIDGKALDTDTTATAKLDKTVASNNGWTRQILKFNTGSSKYIKILLGADNIASDHVVYFDDINIEPVLEVNQDANGNKSYVSRECRLYPTNDSLTCVNKNNNVLKNGWEGYCLEHDISNPDVCLMWYPVDTISSTRLTQTTSGYQGKFPLNYCTEVNGNFDLVEKRVGAKLQDGAAGGTWNTDCIARTDVSQCASCPGGSCKDYYVFGTNDGKYDKGGCFPKEELLLPGTITKKNFSDVLGLACPDGKPQTYSDGWAVYDGFGTSTCQNDPCSIYDKNGNLQSNIAVGAIVQDESRNADPSVRIYDYSHVPANEDDLLQYNSADTEKNYRLTCNNFIQTVDYNGDNKAWVARVGMNSIWATSTPPYFVDDLSLSSPVFFGYGGRGSVHNIAAYGRNRQDTPFGAATWPDGFNLMNSEAIKLRDQYSSKNKEDVLAGRPYGCSNSGGSGTGCANIGFCSLDPNVYCFLGSWSTAAKPDYVALQTCSASGLGTCVPLWSKYLGAVNTVTQNTDYQSILSSLFLKAYNAYSFDGNSYISSKFNLNSVPANECDTKRPEASYSDISSAVNSFCYVKPLIGNQKIKYNNQVISTGGASIIQKKGVYSLEFTTVIDPEQQPLKEIDIDWGDKTNQVITGQDSHPSADNPHIFYHYYKITDVHNIGISALDNWGERRNVSFDGQKWTAN